MVVSTVVGVLATVVDDPLVTGTVVVTAGAVVEVEGADAEWWLEPQPATSAIPGSAMYINFVWVFIYRLLV